MNRERGEWGLACEGQSYTLRLTVEACCELEGRTGLSFDELTARVNRGRVKELRWMLWGALQDRHAEAFATPEATGYLIDAMGGIGKAQKVLTDFMALNADEPQPTQGKKPAPKPPPRGSVWRRLYLDARGMGLSGDAFWRLSLKELWLEMAAARAGIKNRRDEAIRLAQYISAFVWTKDPRQLYQELTADGAEDDGGLLVTGLYAVGAAYGLRIRVKKRT